MKEELNLFKALSDETRLRIMVLLSKKEPGMVGASNFFELSVAVAISLFGLKSGAALATVVGVLTEVPIMLSIVNFSNKTRYWFTE